MPYITGRFNPGNSPEMAQRLPRGVIYEIQRMYYDTAQAFNEYTLPTFTTLVPHDHILFGTDYPFARAETVARGLAASGLTADEVRAIERANALALLPRLAAR